MYEPYLHLYELALKKLQLSSSIKFLRVHDFCPPGMLRLPDLTGMFTDIPPKPDDLPPLIHFELVYHSNTNYDCVVSHSGYLCEDLPALNPQEIYLDEIL